MNGIFDLSSADDFFFSIERSFEKYQTDGQKSIELLLYIIMGLNHLREWIAPGYVPEKDKIPNNDEKILSKTIYYNNTFEKIRFLCNKTKHFKKGINTSSSHGLSFDEWSDIDSVINFDIGPATNYFVDNTNISEIIKEVIDLYKKEWFEKKK